MKTLGAVESFTGGLFASTITAQSGASQFFKGALITYANTVKKTLGVDVSKGVINARVARQMALKGKKFLQVDYCVAFTGNAGPQAMEQKPVGLVFIAINEKVYDLKLEGSRQSIQKQAVDFAIAKLKKIWKEK